MKTEWSDFSTLCRLCLVKGASLNVLFQTDITIESIIYKTINANGYLNYLLQLCIDSKIENNNEYPQLLCENCATKLIEFDSFRKQCLLHGNCLLEEKAKWNEENSTRLLTEELELSLNFDEIVNPFGNSIKRSEFEQIESKAKVKPKLIKPKRENDLKRASKTSRISKSRIRKTEQCQICGVMQTNIHTHIKVHSTDKQYECAYCGKKFSIKYNLKSHFDIHFDTRSFTCPMCPHKFRQAAHLRRHITTHTGERDHQCNICNRRFRQSGTRDEHRRAHFQERTIKCDHCDKLFLNKKGLKNHIGIHTGVRPFACFFCGMTFTTSSSASVHRRKHLKGDAYECHVCKMSIKPLQLFKTHLKSHGLSIEKLWTIDCS